MWGLGITSMATLVLFGFLAYSLNAQGNAAHKAQLQGTATHLAAYSNIVKAYENSNTGFTGTASDAALAPYAPAWFTRTSAESNYVSGGVTYAYVTTQDAATALAVAKLVGGISSGVKVGTTLTQPGTGATTTSIPNAVPAGAVVNVQ